MRHVAEKAGVFHKLLFFFKPETKKKRRNTSDISELRNDILLQQTIHDKRNIYSCVSSSMFIL